jgi:multiple sugar transport system permease protein
MTVTDFPSLIGGQISRVKPAGRRRKTRLVARGFRYVTLAIVAIWILLPIIWCADVAFQSSRTSLSLPPRIFFKPTLANFRTLGANGFYGDLLHSLILMLLSTSVALILGVPAGYGLARSRSRWTGPVSVALMCAYIVPALIYMVPLYAFYEHLGLLGSYFALVLYYETFELPLTVFLMKGYFSDIPVEVDEAARIDGCSRLAAFRKVTLPLCRPGVATVALLVGLTSWGEYYGALIFSGPGTTTAPVGISLFYGEGQTSWPALAAGGLLTILPVLGFATLLQRSYMRRVIYDIK